MHERLYRSLFRIRRVEEEVARAYPSDRIKSPVHLSIGQEAVAVGVCAALRPDDVVFGTTVSGRPADLDGVETTVGLFITTLPTRVARPVG